MAISVVTKLIDVDAGGLGHDYTSLDAWEDAHGGTVSADLTATGDGEIAVAQCANSSGGADTTPVVVSGWTTDATRYIQIESYAGYRHSGVWSNSKYHLAIAGDPPIEIAENFVNIDGIQISVDPDANGEQPIEITAADTSCLINISNLIIKSLDTDGTYACQGIKVTDTQAIVKIWNSVIYGFVGSSGAGIESNNATSVDVYNCTVSNNISGIKRGAGTVTVINCAVFNNTDDFDGTMTITYSASDDTQAGTGNIDWDTGATDWAAAFTDYANADFSLKSGGSLVDTGNGATPKGTFTDDITGVGVVNRGLGTDLDWDIGAFEYAAAGGLSIPVAMYHYQSQ